MSLHTAAVETSQSLIAEAVLPLGIEDVVLRPAYPIIPVPEVQASTILDKARAGLQKLAPISHAIIETGRFVKKYKIGLSYAIGVVAAGYAVYNAAKGVGDLNFYETISDAANNLLGVDHHPARTAETASDDFLASGTASSISAVSILAGTAMRNFNKEDAAEQAREMDGTFEEDETPEPEHLVVVKEKPADVELPAYPRPGYRLSWMDEDGIFVRTAAQPNPGELLVQRLEKMLKEESGQHELVKL